MRYFLAIPLPEEIKKELHAINAFLSKFKDLRLVSPDNMHLTLLFLGENGDLKKIDKLKKINFDSFNLKTKKVSVFPSDGKIKLVWIELEESKKLLRLQQKISELFNITANYKPHITLARIKKIDKGTKQKLIGEIDKFESLKLNIPVKNFKLYGSELTVLGPVHRVIEYFEANKSKSLGKTNGVNKKTC